MYYLKNIAHHSDVSVIMLPVVNEVLEVTEYNDWVAHHVPSCHHQ